MTMAPFGRIPRRRIRCVPGGWGVFARAVFGGIDCAFRFLLGHTPTLCCPQPPPDMALRSPLSPHPPFPSRTPAAPSAAPTAPARWPSSIKTRAGSSIHTRRPSTFRARWRAGPRATARFHRHRRRARHRRPTAPSRRTGRTFWALAFPLGRTPRGWIASWTPSCPPPSGQRSLDPATTTSTPLNLAVPSCLPLRA